MVIAGGYIYDQILNSMNSKCYDSSEAMDIDCFFYKGNELLL